MRVAVSIIHVLFASDKKCAIRQRQETCDQPETLYHSKARAYDIIIFMDNLFEQFCKTIAVRDLLNDGDQVVVGVSGGADSICLLDLLVRWSVDRSVRIYVAHINHQLRGEAADEDAAAVISLAESYGLPVRVLNYDVAGQAAEQGRTIEEMARLVRYKAFFEWKSSLEDETTRGDGTTKKDGTTQKDRTSGRVRVAVAHNQNDQAETVLLRLIRGTGPAGLAGMEYLREDGLIRPLLDIPRKQIEAYVSARGLPVCQDATNLQATYARNRLRLELIPLLEQDYNPAIVEALCRLAGNAAEDRDFFVKRVKQAELKLERDAGVTTEILRVDDRSSYKTLPAAVAKRLLIRRFQSLGLDQDLTAAHLNAADQLIRSHKSPGMIELPHGYGLSVEGGRICYQTPSERAKPAVRQRRSRTFTDYGSYMDFETGETVIIKPIDRDQYLRQMRQNETGGEKVNRACFDADRLAIDAGLVLRGRQAGDYIMPLGMTGTKKIQNLFTDVKIPLSARDGWPLLCRGSEVIWAVGLRQSEKYKVSPESQRIVLVEFSPSVC